MLASLFEAPQPGAILSLDLRQPSRNDLPLWDHYQVQPPQDRRLVPSKALAKQSLRTISLDSSADAPAHGEPQAPDPDSVFDHHEQEQWTIQPQALSKDPAVLRRAPDSLRRWQTGGGQGPSLRR
jgi:hypothetical protein